MFNFIILIPVLLTYLAIYYFIFATIARRFEIRADKFAVKYSGKIPFVKALLKTSWRSLVQEYFEKNSITQLFSTHPSTYQRLLNILQVK